MNIEYTIEEVSVIESRRMFSSWISVRIHSAKKESKRFFKCKIVILKCNQIILIIYQIKGNLIVSYTLECKLKVKLHAWANTGIYLFQSTKVKVAKWHRKSNKLKFTVILHRTEKQLWKQFTCYPVILHKQFNQSLHGSLRLKRQNGYWNMFLL